MENLEFKSKISQFWDMKFFKEEGVSLVAKMRLLRTHIKSWSHASGKSNEVIAHLESKLKEYDQDTHDQSNKARIEQELRQAYYNREEILKQK